MTKQISMEERNGVRALFHSDSPIPTYGIGPALINGEYAQGEIPIVVATNETAMIPSIARGLKVTKLAGGIETHVLKDEMTRAPLVVARTSADAEEIKAYLDTHYDRVAAAVNATTRYGHTESIETITDNEERRGLYIRLGMFCGDAAGHNMTTIGGNALINHLLERFGEKIELTDSSSNRCTDKKPALVNKQNGRGKWVKAETVIPQEIVERNLRTSAEEVEKHYLWKIIRGSELAGSLGRNAHHANLVNAVYNATGQDTANTVDSSYGDTIIEARGGDLYFAVDMPVIIVGTVGGGTKQHYAQRHLEMMGCFGPGEPSGSHARKLAEIVAATTLAGELSLIASLTKGDHMKAHTQFER